MKHIIYILLLVIVAGFTYAIPMRHHNVAISDTNIVELNLWRLFI